MFRREQKRALLLLTVVHLFVMSPLSAYAQAWVDDPNSLSVSVMYNAGPSTSIVETQGQSIPRANTIHHVLLFGVDYTTPLEGLALSAQVPLMGVQYTGASPFFPAHGSYDDGDLHFVLQDFRADIRYAPPIPVLQEDIMAVAVHFAGTIPTHNYETEGFASAGRGLKQMHFGISVGRTLDPILPRLFLHFRYEFSLSERFKTDFVETGDYNQNYSSMGAQIGYFILDGLQVNAAANIRIAHGGFDYLDWARVPEVVRNFHDVLVRENSYLVGGGVNYEIVTGLTASAFFRAFVGGTNTRNGHIFGGGFSYQIF